MFYKKQHCTDVTNYSNTKSSIARTLLIIVTPIQYTKKGQHFKLFKNFKNYMKFLNFQKKIKISKISNKFKIFIKFQILKNDKTIIAYHFGQYMDLQTKIYIDLGLPPRSIYVCRSIHSSCDTVDLMVLCQFSDICGPQDYGFHPIKNLGNCDLDFVAPFNSNFENKTLCESRVDNSFHYIISYLWKAIFVSYFFFLCIFPTYLYLLVSKVSYSFFAYF